MRTATQKISNWIPLVLLVLAGCTEPIDLSLKTNPKRLVVDAIISNDPYVQVVRLSWSVPYFSTTPSPPVSGATVTIHEEESVYFLRESTEHPGYYFILPEVFLPQPGKTYTLKIEGVQNLDDDVETTVYTATTVMPEVVRVDSLTLRYQYFNKDWVIWQVLAFYQDPPDETNYYMFRISQNNNRVTSRPSDIRVSSDKYFNGNYVNGLWVQSIDAREGRRVLNEGDLITLEVASITKEFYKFLEAIKMDEQGSDPLFSGPPANIPGNISNGALGFFTAIHTSTATIVYDPAKHD